jgi:hydrocephalus-inducing protein
VLRVKEKHKINVTFISNRLGEFNEVFKWVLKDTNEYIALNFKGNVIAPSFEFDVDRINFGQVSFNFDYQKLIKVKNISRVPFVFKLRVPGDDTGLVQEFKLEPSLRQIEPQETAMVNLIFTPAQAIQ